jgi:hypothetical protein
MTATGPFLAALGRPERLALPWGSNGFRREVLVLCGDGHQ